MAEPTLSELHRRRERLGLERIETRLRLRRAEAELARLTAAAAKSLLTPAERALLDGALERRATLQRSAFDLEQQLLDAEERIATLTVQRIAGGRS